MKNFNLPALALACAALLLQPTQAWTEEDSIAQEEAAAASVKDRPEWNDNLKSKYSLTDEQLAELKAKGMNYPQIAISAQLAEMSGKTIDEVVKMRIDEKMGWGKMAKLLGVAPREIGHSIRDMRHKIHDNRMIAKDERRANRMEKKAEKKAERAQKAAEKSAKRHHH